MTGQELLIDATDAAKLLSTTRRRVLRLAREGRIPFVDLGDDEPRFNPDELLAWVQAKSRKGEPDAK